MISSYIPALQRVLGARRPACSRGFLLTPRPAVLPLPEVAVRGPRRVGRDADVIALALARVEVEVVRGVALKVEDVDLQSGDKRKCMFLFD